MTCREAKSLMSRFVDADLGTEDRQAMERHLALCESCRDEVETLRNVLAVCERVLTPPPSAHRFERLVGLLHPAPPEPVRAFSLWREAFRLVAAAAMILMLISTADFVVMHVRHVVQVAEKTIYAPLTPDEFAKGPLGWRQRIAWAESLGDFLFASPVPKPNATTPEADPEPSTENTTWIPLRHPRFYLCGTPSCDLKTGFVSYTG